MRRIGKFFLQGLIAILPIALTIYILFWLAGSAESMLGGLIKLFLPESWYITGMGVVAGFAIVLGVGILLQLWLFRKLFGLGEMILEKIPLVKSLYGSIRDLMGFFDASKKKDFNEVVMVEVVDKDTRLMGLVTREDFSELPDGIKDGETVAVYLPMSYQMGGFTLFVPKEKVKAVDMSIDEAMRFTLTAAVSSQKKQKTEANENRENDAE